MRVAKFLRSFIFLLTSFVHISWAEAKGLIAPSQIPESCVELKMSPCIVSTGDRPQRLEIGGHTLELDKNTLLSTGVGGQMRLHQGALVVQVKDGSLRMANSFAWAEIGQSKVYLRAEASRLVVKVLDGEKVQVHPRGVNEPESLLPGTENWYSSPLLAEASRGVAQVIQLENFAKERAGFFLDFELGLHSELATVATHVKSQAIQMSQAYRNLVNRKIASLEEVELQKQRRREERIQFDEKIRELFLRRLSHQD